VPTSPAEATPGTRRARLEARLERRTAWAGKATQRSEARLARARGIGDRIAFGQPILVGHHSEGRARADAERIHSNMSKAVEESRLASHHEQRAAGIAAQLERSVFSDDDDAVEALEARIAEREAQVAHRKAVNAAFKKALGDTPARFAALVASGLMSRAEALSIAGTMARNSYERPFPSYSLTNLNANIRRDRERIAELQRRQARTQDAQAQGGVKLEGVGEYVRVTFAEKPAREVLEALREAGFRWGAGSWVGERTRLPAAVAGAVPG
jgi:chromosome segregation ATPase